MKKIIVIGAGYAGLFAAKRLEKHYRKDDEVHITLIDRNSYSTMLTELHEVAAGRVDEESIKMDLSDIFARRKIDVVLDNVQTVDFKKKVVKGEAGNYDYDYLIIASGCKPTFFGAKGSEKAFQLWSYQDAVDLKEQILNCFRKACSTPSEEERRKLLTFNVVGSGFTGVEMAGELGEYKDELCAKFDIPLDEVTINILDVLPRILPAYPDVLQTKAENKLSQLGVTLLMGAPVTEIGDDYLVAGDKKVPGYTTIWAAGVEGSELLDNTKDVKQEGRGRYVTNEFLQMEGHPEVYVAGDNIFYIPEGEERPVPQMVENAEQSGHVTADNVIASIDGGSQEVYKPTFNGSMVCIGGRYGVAQVKLLGKERNLSGFMAMFIKHVANVLYFIRVLGLHKVYSYAKNEFFIIRKNRSFLGGHFSNRKNAPTVFLVPLRIFLGIMWLSGGIAKLPGILKDWRNVTAFPNRAMRYALSSGAATNTGDATSAATGAMDAATAATGAADAVTAATGAAEGGGEALTGFAGFAQWLADTFEVRATNAAPTIPFLDGMMNWVYETFMWSGDTGFTTTAAIFQVGMTLSEIAVGGMFILGLFTPLAAVMAFMMSIMIWMSGWSYVSIFFYGLAGLACLMAGNAFGLDYYVLPWLDKKLRTWSLTKKWYLFFK